MAEGRCFISSRTFNFDGVRGQISTEKLAPRRNGVPLLSNVKAVSLRLG